LGHGARVRHLRDQRQRARVEEAADLDEFLIRELGGVQFVDAETTLRTLDVVLDLLDERGWTDQPGLDVGVEALGGEREVAALIEIEVHEHRVPSRGGDVRGFGHRGRRALDCLHCRPRRSAGRPS